MGISSKIKKGELEKLRVSLHSKNGIQTINVKEKFVQDDLGEFHDYDLLVMATGSRAFVPNEVRMDLPGRFTMRERNDADRLKKYLSETKLPPSEQHVVIVGGAC